MLNRVVALVISEQLRFKLIFVLMIFLFLLAMKFYFSLVSPFLFGLFITYLIEKPVTLLRRWFGFPRSWAVFFVLLITVLLLALSLTFFLTRLYHEARELLVDLPSQINLISRGLERIKGEFTTGLQWPEGFWDYGSLWVDNLRLTVSGLLQNAINLGVGFPVFLFNLFLSCFTAFFLSRDRQKIKHWILAVFPKRWQTAILVLHRQTLVSGWSFLQAQFLLAMLTGLLSAVFLAFLGFTKPWFVGTILGVFDFLPVVGPAVVFLPWIGWQLAVGKVLLACYLGLIFFVTMGVRQLLEVRLVGTKLGLHPLVVLVSLYIGVKGMGARIYIWTTVLFSPVRILSDDEASKPQNGLALKEGD